MSPQMKKLIHFTHSFSLPSFFLVLENWAQILAKNGRHVPILSYTLALLFFFNLRQDSLKHEVLLSQCLRLPLFPSPLSGVKLLWATRPSSIIYYNCMRNFFFFNFWDYNITTSFPPSPSSPPNLPAYIPHLTLFQTHGLFSQLFRAWIYAYIFLITSSSVCLTLL